MAKKRARKTRDLAWGSGFVSEIPRAGGVRFQARWYERQPDGSDTLRARSFGSRDDAEDHLRQRARDRRDGRYTPSIDITVRQVLLDYLERGKGRWKPTTYATYRQRAFAHIIPHVGILRAVELTTARIQHWIDQISRSGLHPKTVGAAVRVLSSALTEAAILGIVRHNEARGVKVPSAPAPTHRTWTEREIARVLAAVAMEPMWHALYRVALLTGIRPGELRALTWPAVDLERGVIVVRATITRNSANRQELGTSTKTGKPRAVALPRSCVDTLRTWRAAQNQERLAAKVWDERGFVFTGQRGQFLSGSSWRRYQEALAKRSGVPAISLHELRHTNATVELQAGTHPRIVSDRLGHRRVETTLNLYSHVSPDLQRAAIDALESRIAVADASIKTGK